MLGPRLIIDPRKLEAEKKHDLYLNGKINPKDFIEIGDLLILKCPGFKWNETKDNCFKELPKEKQYLSTIIYSYKRVNDYLLDNKTTEKILEEDWVNISLKNKIQKFFEDYNDNFVNEDNSDDFIICDDLIILDDNKDTILCYLMIKKKLKKEEYNSEIIQKLKNMNIYYKAIYKTCCLPDSLFYEIMKYLYEKEDINIKIRTYELSITYDLYYMVPRIWIMGYNHKGTPLTKGEIQDDIFPPCLKAFIYEQNPATGILNYSIYPCRHSKLFLNIIQHLKENKESYDKYNIIMNFLKIIQEMIPTIKFDFLLD